MPASPCGHSCFPRLAYATKAGVPRRVDAGEHRAVVPDFEAVYEIDTEGVDTLLRLHDQLHDRDITMVLARTHGDVLDYLQRDDGLGHLGPNATFGTVRDAVDAAT